MNLIKSVQSLTLFLILAAIVFFTGCQQQSDNSNDQVEANIKMYTNVWDEILNKGNIDMIDTHFAEDYVNKTVTSTVNGKADAKEYFGAFLTGFSDINFVVDEIFGVDDRVIKLWTFNGTHSGDFAGIPATGNKITLKGVSVSRIVNGKISEELDYMDDLGFMQQLGVIPLMGQ
ncbi:MAG: ester cyclase [Ignavibacteria bacterium]|nr:ester cyclase [Ignavibacteria bacterium]MBT8381112.1 ester cyclase [Ignavibacteria bacterium]MBT8392148.1 ester cyclase [Ignavibacteria bacterium]NNJ53548.1 ester cyclase [Ignavibacteriaceae bacterium]NNL21420.1 ester cyclase [Ignavibacteriaceae bacterium]